MCLDNNTASLSVRYMNAQLHALWENAKECASQGHYSDFKSTEYEKSKYTRAIGEYHYLPKKAQKGLHNEELFFFAKFAAPKLEFICNHEAVLHLTIESGHLNLAHKDAVRSGARADKSKNCPISNLEVVFRVPFLRTNVKGRDAKIGNEAAKHLIQMIVLRIREARLLMYSPDQSLSAGLKDALRFYMQQYLLLLESAGNHVFFDLPDFDDNKHRPVSNYALIHNESIDMLRKEHSEDIKLLDELECSLLSKFYDIHWVAHSSQRNNEAAWGSLDICLATICSDWIIGSETQKNFFINFNKPIIEALCPHEVIVKFDVKEIGFFGRANIDDDCEPTHQYFNWQIAFIVEVGKPEGGGLVQLNLNSARFSRHHSCFGEHTHTVDIVIREHIEYIISFISVDYLDLISRSQLHIVLGFPSIPGGPRVNFDEDWSETDEGEESGYEREHGRVSLWSERIETTIYGGYDQAIALSEASINLVLQSRCTAVSTWQRDRFFSMDVRPLSIRLLTNGKAIVYVQAEGKIGVKKTTAFRRFWTRCGWSAPTETDELEEYEFETVTLAYEVDLKLQAQDILVEEATKRKEVTETTTTEVKRTTVTEETATRSSRGALLSSRGGFLGKFVDAVEHTFGINHNHAAKVSTEVSATSTTKTTTTTTTSTTTTRKSTETETEVGQKVFDYLHLILDYKNARYVKELSEVTALGNGDEALDRLATVQSYLPLYLAELTQFGHNVIHTIAVCKPEFVSTNIFAFTCVDFKVLTKREITIKTCAQGSNTSEMPLVLLYGMCGRREMSPFVGSWLPGLIPVGPKAVGTLALSYKIFLQRCLIEPLKLINESTTIVPSGADVVDGVWHIDLCTWDHHKTRSQSKTGCAWRLMSTNVPTGCMGYEWKYRDEWSHEHEGSSHDEANGEYKLSCNTHNKLIIPVSYNRKGMDIVMSGESSIALSGKTDNEKWTKKSVAAWQATIKVDTTNGGLKVSVDYKAPSLTLHNERPHCCHFDIAAKHRSVMASKLFAFEQRVLPQLRLAVENTWKYSTMGIQTVSLRDPVFTKKGDLICELDLSKDALDSCLLSKDTWKSHCGSLYAPTVSSGNGQVSYSSGKTTNVSGYLQYSNGSATGNGYNVIQTLTASKPTTALSSGYSLSVSDSHHEQDSLSEDEEDHDGN